MYSREKENCIAFREKSNCISLYRGEKDLEEDSSRGRGPERAAHDRLGACDRGNPRFWPPL